MRTRASFIGAGTLLLSLLLWFPRPSPAASESKIEVRRFEAAHVLGRPGLKIRLTLRSGEAVEYQVDDPNETQLTIHLADLFLSGHARMFAELDGGAVRAIQVSGGPSVSVGQ